MPPALSKDLITRILVKYLDASDTDEDFTQRSLALSFTVSTGKISQLIRDFEDGATPEELVCAGQSGAKKTCRKMDASVRGVLAMIVERDQAAMLSEMADMLFLQTNVAVDVSTICRALKELGYSRKIIYKRANEARLVLQQKFLQRCAINYKAEQLIFLDEVGMDSRTSRRKFAYATVGDRTTVEQRQVKMNRITALGVLSGTGGLLDWFMVPGGMGSLDLAHAVEDSVVPHLNPFPGPNSVIVLDNCGTHRNTEVMALIRATGALIEFLPPYTPQFNPIESVFNVAKAWLKRNSGWVDLPDVTPTQALGAALRSITFENAMGFIRGTGVYTWDVEPLQRRSMEAVALQEEEARAVSRAQKRRKVAILLLLEGLLDDE